MVFAVLLLVKRGLPFDIKKEDFRWNAQCPRFLKIGLPLAFQEIMTQCSFLALCAFINRLGLGASSGYGVACKIVNFAMLVPSALMQSMASFVSQNVGAGKHKRAKQSLFTGMGVRPGCGKRGIYPGISAGRYAVRFLYHGYGSYRQGLRLSEGLCPGDPGNRNPVQHDGIF